MDRALPSWAIDVIRDGVPASSLRAQGDRAVWSACVRTAASASQRGQECWEWVALVLDKRSNLGRQAAVKGGRRVRSDLALREYLDAAWETATAWVSEQPAKIAWSANVVTAEQLREYVADAETPLGDVDRALILEALDQAAKRQSLSPVLPRREVVERTGLGDRAVRNGLERLSAAGVLPVVHVGRSGGDPSKRKAHCYGLPTREAVDRYLYRGTRSMGPPAQVYGTPTGETAGTPGKVYGTSPRRERIPWVRGDDREALAAALAALDEPEHLPTAPTWTSLAAEEASP